MISGNVNVLPYFAQLVGEDLFSAIFFMAFLVILLFATMVLFVQVEQKLFSSVVSTNVYSTSETVTRMAAPMSHVAAPTRSIASSSRIPAPTTHVTTSTSHAQLPLLV